MTANTDSRYSGLDDDSLKEIEIEEEPDLGSEETITQPFSPSDIQLTNPPMNLGDLIDMMKEGWIKYDPEYQRAQNLWDQDKQSRLIESALLGLRLPAFYFEEISKKQWTIIDGLQRCCAIRNFCVDESMTLTNLEFLGNQFKEKKYSDLDFSTRRDIRMTPITVNLLAKGVPPSVKYILFKRLNTGGIPLTDQEIRNAVYCGPAIRAIAGMADREEFKKATQYHVETKRRTDMDFVSRFTAFYVLGWKNYEPNLDSFINYALGKLNKENDAAFLNRMTEDFTKSMELAFAIFKDRAFRKQRSLCDRRRPLNKAYFEVISSAFAKLTNQQQAELLIRKELLNANMCTAMDKSETYRNAFSGGTGAPSAVSLRHSWMESIIQYTLANQTITISDDNKIITS